MAAIRPHFITKEVPQVEPSGLLKFPQGASRVALKTKIDVLRRARAPDSKLDDETAFENHPLAEAIRKARQHTLEHEELTQTGEGRRRQG